MSAPPAPPPPSPSQAAFAAALLDPARPIPDGLVGPDGAPDPKRFAVYRNNVVVGLVEALAAGFPVTVQLVGEAFFRAAARLYALDHPPRTPVMALYGAGFADFLATFPPLAAHAYVADVARLEYARREAYHAADAASLSGEVLRRVAPERLGDLAFALHPSVRVVASPFPVLSILLAHLGTAPPDVVAVPEDAEEVLVARPADEVVARRLPPGGAAFVTALAAGATLGAAAASALEVEPRFDLAAALTELLAAGAIAAVRLDGRALA